MSKELLEQTRKENLYNKYLLLKDKHGYDVLSNLENASCTDCVACKNCTTCTDCAFCISCKRCISCVDCENSSNLIYCAGLINHYRGYWIHNQEVSRQEFNSVKYLLVPRNKEAAQLETTSNNNRKSSREQKLRLKAEAGKAATTGIGE